ncbi:MAG TPA: hypothetical protein VGR16_13285 [Thermomicrobiales bacterium]|nr:hypothetical protein [Thermomicrobiales bacterium]
MSTEETQAGVGEMANVETTRLYHYSEDGTIVRLDPRPSSLLPDHQHAVWAIDAEHAPHYWFPRDCPRIACWAGPGTTILDATRFLGYSRAEKIIAIEAAWLARVRKTELYAYEMPAETFAIHDVNAGYYLSRAPVLPLAIEPVGDLLARLVSIGIELRITPSLQPLRDALVVSTMAFSMIRLRNMEHAGAGAR